MKLIDYLVGTQPANNESVRDTVNSDLFKLTLDMHSEIAELLDRGYSWPQICSAAKRKMIHDNTWDPRWDMWKIKAYYKLIIVNGGIESCQK